jgi:tetratricopeptide (TPR) repeat protein
MKEKDCSALKIALFFIFSINFSIFSSPIFTYLNTLKNKNPQDINLQKSIFTIEKLLKKNALSKNEYNAKIRKIIKNIKSFIRKGEHPKTTFSKITEYLINYEAFQPTGLEDSWATNLFTSFLTNKKGSCLPFSLLYLVIGENLKLPLFGAISPEHIFVRFQNPKTSFNIETVYFQLKDVIYEPGTFVKDKMYKRAFKIPTKAIKNGYFLKTLNKKEVIGIYLNNVGALALKDALYSTKIEEFIKKTNFARKILMFATKLHPNNFSAYLNLANSYTLWLPNKPMAKKFLSLAKKILINQKTRILQAEFLIRNNIVNNPNYFKYLNIPLNVKNQLLTKFYLKKEEYKNAKKYAIKVLQNNPDDQEFFSYYIYSLIKLNQLDYAILLLEHFIKSYSATPSYMLYVLLSLAAAYKNPREIPANDLINVIENYTLTISWTNLLNKNIFKAFSILLSNEKNTPKLLNKYLTFFQD